MIIFLLSGFPAHAPNLIVIGYVDYEDLLKRKRRTAFLRLYDFTTKRFTPSDDPAYEYQD